MAIVRTVLAVLLAVLALPSVASALPGDAPLAPIAPADGAALPVNTGGITASYSCPVYRTFSAGDGFDLFGGPQDYAVGVATSADVDADGRVAAANRVAIVAGSGFGWTAVDGVCSGPVAASGGPSQRFQEIPGTYYWQVWRICTGCAGSYEVGPVRRFTLNTTAKPSVGAVKTAYVGYPVLVPLELPGFPTGTTAIVERKSGGGWKTVGTGDAVGESGIAVAHFSKVGKETIRVRAKIGTDTVFSAEKTVTVKPSSSPRSTSKKDDGQYADDGAGIESLALKATVKGGGKDLSGLQALVPTLCPSVDPGTFTTQIVTVKFSAKIRIAPDGRFVAARSPETSTSFFVSGRIKGRKLTEGHFRVSVGSCSGDRTFTGKRK